MYEKITMVKLKFIQEPQVPVRTFVQEEKFDELVSSIKIHGVIEPIICNDCGEHLEIIAGHRRYMASKIAELDTIPCIVTKLSESDQEKIKLHENYGREDVSPVDEAFFFKHYMEKNNLDINAMSSEISKSRNYIERRLSVLDFHPQLLKAVKDSILSFSCAVELNKIDNENELLRAIEYSHVNGCTTKIAQSWVHQWLSTKASLDHANVEPAEGSEPSPAGTIIWPCFVCETPKNATDTYNIPVCKSCRDAIIKQKEDQRNEQ